MARQPSSALPFLFAAVAGCTGQAATQSRGAPYDADAGGATDGGPGDELASGSTNSKCGPTPTRIVGGALDANSGLAGSSASISVATDIAVNATDLYFVINANPPPASLWRVPIRGGAPVRIASLADQADTLLLTPTSVLVAESAADGMTGEIVRLPLDGGAVTQLAPTKGSIPASLVAAGGNVYFADTEGVKSVPLAGGPAHVVGTQPGALALMGSRLVVATGSALLGLPLTGGAATELATNLVGASGPVVGCGADVCWAAGAAGGMFAGEGTGSVWRLAPGGAPTSLASDASLYFVWRLVFDGTHFFATVLTDASPGALVRIPAAGGTPVPMGTGTGVAVDDECLYSFDVLLGIYSVEKSYAGRFP